MKILGRLSDDDTTDPRSACDLAYEETFAPGFFVGEINVKVWKSTDREDRGGVVVEIGSEPGLAGLFL